MSDEADDNPSNFLETEAVHVDAVGSPEIEVASTIEGVSDNLSKTLETREGDAVESPESEVVGCTNDEAAKAPVSECASKSINVEKTSNEGIGSRCGILKSIMLADKNVQQPHRPVNLESYNRLMNVMKVLEDMPLLHPYEESCGQGQYNCPFYWQQDLCINVYGNHEADLLSEFEEMLDETSFELRRFITHLVMSYQNFYKRLIEDSIQNMNEMEKILCDSTRKCSHDGLFQRIGDALLHVSRSCWVYILETTNQSKEGSEVVQKIKTCNQMDKANQAAIWGIRAAVYVEYDYEAIKKAIKYVDRAIKLDSGNVYWHFLKGLYLGRLRRVEKISTNIPDVEILCVEKAAQQLNDPVFYALTAETYLDIVESIPNTVGVDHLSKENDPSIQKLCQILDTFTKTAAKYFNKSVEMGGNNALLLIRCGRGFMRLRHPHQDLKKAEKLLRKGLALSPENSYGNHAMAKFYMEYKKDGDAAELYLEKSVERNNFEAHLDLCRKRLLEDENSVTLELKNLLDVHKAILKMCRVYGELICCHLFLRYDLVEASYYATNLINQQTTWMNYIKKFNSRVFPFSRSVPLIEVLVNEIKKKLSIESTNDVEKNAYKTFLHHILKEGAQIKMEIRMDILQWYVEDMKEGLRKQRQFLVVKSNAERKRNRSKERCRLRYLGLNKDYRKYYPAYKVPSLCDILPTWSPNESASMKKNVGGIAEERRESEVPCENKCSTSSSEKMSKTNKSGRDCRSSSVEVRPSRSGWMVETPRDNRSDKKRNYKSSDRESVSSSQDRYNDSRHYRKARSPSSSLDRKSSRSCRHSRRHEDRRRASDRSSSSSSRSSDSDFSHRRRNRRSESKRSERIARSGSGGNVESTKKHERREGRLGPTHRSRSSSKDRGRETVTRLIGGSEYLSIAEPEIPREVHSSSSSDRKCSRLNRSKEKTASDRDLVSSTREETEDMFRSHSPCSSPDRKSVRSKSAPKHRHRRNKNYERSTSSSSSTSSKSNSSNERRRRRKESTCSEQFARSESGSSVESLRERRRHDGGQRERSHEKERHGERSRSSDESRHGRRHSHHRNSTPNYSDSDDSSSSSYESNSQRKYRSRRTESRSSDGSSIESTGKRKRGEGSRGKEHRDERFHSSDRSRHRSKSRYRQDRRRDDSSGGSSSSDRNRNNREQHKSRRLHYSNDRHDKRRHSRR